MPTAAELINKSVKGFKTGYANDPENIIAGPKELLEKCDDYEKEKIVLNKRDISKRDRLNIAVDIEKTANPDIEYIKRRNDDILLCKSLLDNPCDGARRNVDVRSMKLYKRFMRDIESGVGELAKIMSVGGSGTGAEWIPTGWSTQLQEKIQLERKLAALIPQFTMQQTPYKYPIQTTFALAQRQAEDTDSTDSTVGTGSPTFTAQKLTVSIPVTYEDEEDSIIDMLPLVKQQMAIALSRAEENCLINGAYTTNPGTALTTYDSDNGTIGNVREMISATNYFGLRCLALANSYVTSLTTLYDTDVIAMAKALGVYFDPTKCAFVAGTSMWLQLATVKTSGGIPLLQSYYNTGDAKQTFMNAANVGHILGVPVIRSEFMRELLNTSGYYDGITTTTCGLLLFRTDAFKIGNHKRGVMVESERRPRTQRTDLIASMRQDFQSMFPIASNKVVNYGYNHTT